MFYPREDIDCLLLCYNPGDQTSLHRCLEYNNLSVWAQSSRGIQPWFSYIYILQSTYLENYSTDIYRCLVGLNYGLQSETERVEEDEVQRLARSLNCSYLEIYSDQVRKGKGKVTVKHNHQVNSYRPSYWGIKFYKICWTRNVPLKMIRGRY